MKTSEEGKSISSELEQVLENLKQYLQRVVPAILDLGDVSVLEKSLIDRDTVSLQRHFIEEMDCVSQIQRYYPTTDSAKEYFYFSLHMKSEDVQSPVSLAFLKSTPSCLTTGKLSNQIKMVQLDTSAPYDNLLQLVRHCFLPTLPSSAVNTKLTELHTELSVIAHSSGLSVPLLSLPSSLENLLQSHTDPYDSVYTAQLVEHQSSVISNWKQHILSTLATQHRIPFNYISNYHVFPPSASPVLITETENVFWLSRVNVLSKTLAMLKSNSHQILLKVLAVHKRYAYTVFKETFTNVETQSELSSVVSKVVLSLPFSALKTAESPSAVCSIAMSMLTGIKSLRSTSYSTAKALELCASIFHDVSYLISCIIGHKLEDQLQSNSLLDALPLILQYLQPITMELPLSTVPLIRSVELIIRDLQSRESNTMEVLEVNPAATVRPLVHILDRIQSVCEMLTQCTTLLQSAKQDSSILVEVTQVLDIQLKVGPNYTAWHLVNTHIPFHSLDLTVKTALTGIYRHVEGKFIAELAQQPDQNSRTLLCERNKSQFARTPQSVEAESIQLGVMSLAMNKVREVQDEQSAVLSGSSQHSAAAWTNKHADVSAFVVLVSQLLHMKSEVETLLARMHSIFPNLSEAAGSGDFFRLCTSIITRANPMVLIEGEWLLSATKSLNSFETSPLLKIAPTTMLGFSENVDDQKLSLVHTAAALQYWQLQLPYDFASATKVQNSKMHLVTGVRSAVGSVAYAQQLCGANDAIHMLLSLPLTTARTKMEPLATATWSSRSLASTVTSLLHACKELDSLTQVVVKSVQAIETLLTELKTQAKPTDWTTTIQQMQNHVNSLDHSLPVGYVHMCKYVLTLNNRVEAILVHQISQMLLQFIKKLSHKKVSAALQRDSQAHNEDLPLHIHVLSVEKDQLSVEPPLETGLDHMIGLFETLLAECKDLPKITCHALLAMYASHSISTGTSFTDLVTHLPASIFTQCCLAIHKPYLEAQTYINELEQFQNIHKLTTRQVKLALGSDPSKWVALLRDMKSKVWMVHGVNQAKYGLLALDTSLQRQDLVEKLESQYEELLTGAETVIRELLGQIHENVSSVRNQLEACDLDSADPAALSETLQILQDSDHLEKQWVQQIVEANSLQQLLESEKHVGDKLVNIKQIGTEVGYFSQIRSKRVSKLKTNQAIILARLEQQTEKLKKKISGVYSTWKTDRPVDGALSSVDVEASLEAFADQIESAKNEIKSLKVAQTALHTDVEEHEMELHQLDVISKEIEDIRAMWRYLAEPSVILDTLGAVVLDQVDIKAMKKQLSFILETLEAVPVDYKLFGAFVHLKAKTQACIEALPLLGDICSEFLLPTHHAELLYVLSIKTAWNKTRAKDVLSLANASQLLRAVRVVLDNAQGEAAIQDYLTNELQAQWTQLLLEVVRTHDGGEVVRNWPLVLEKASEHAGDVASMKQSPFFKSFAAEVDKWVGFLTSAMTVSGLAADFQKKWVYLQGIFQSSDVQTQLAGQYRKFKIVDLQYLQFLQDVKIDARVEKWCDPTQGLEKIFENNLQVLEDVQKSLREYLDNQRRLLPRSYFLNDDDLVELQCHSTQPLKAQKHQPKLFAGIDSLVVNETVITHFVSSEMEKVELQTPIPYTQCTSVQQWLTQLETGMCDTLFSTVQRLVAQQDTLQPSDFVHWSISAPTQCICLALRILWTRLGDASIAAGSTANMAVLDMYLSELTRAPPINSNLFKLSRESLITELLFLSNVKPTEDTFAWKQHPRVYLETKEIIIKIATAQFTYGLEYLGVKEALVCSELTSRVYVALATALHTQKSCHMFGPAGTGKTEVVKGFAALLGKQCIVFNCDDTFVLSSVSRIVLGLAQSGAWGCFDEFNRLPEAVLSSISQRIAAVQHALASRNTHVTIGGAQYPVHKDVALFVTSNPTYGGRSKLPNSLKALMRPISMAKPDATTIIHVSLLMQAFKDAHNIASKMVLVFDLAQRQMSSQSHYDFGLRTMKAVLRSTKLLRAQDASLSEVDSVLTALSVTLVPKLLQEDLDLFYTHIQAAFGTKYTTQDKLQSQTLAYISQLTSVVIPSPEFQNKVSQLKAVLQVSQSVIVMGAEGTGKSTIRNLCALLCGNITTHVIDPKAIHKSVLFGHLDGTTLDWHDGIFTALLRTILEEAQPKEHWIVFDGEIDPEWAEALNSVMDDNRVFTLASGERLNVPTRIKLFFECNHVKFASPATISRCAMVWLPSHLITSSMRAAGLLMTNLLTNPNGEAVVAAVAPVILLGYAQQELQSVARERKLMFSGPVLSEGNNSLIELTVQMSTTLTSALQIPLSSCIESFFIHLWACLDDHPSYPRAVVTRSVIYALTRAFCSNQAHKLHLEFTDKLRSILTQLNQDSFAPNTSDSFLEYALGVNGEWVHQLKQVQIQTLSFSASMNPNIIIPTLDTVSSKQTLLPYIESNRAVLLCGPPGSGKSMSLVSLVNAAPSLFLAQLNFSSSTSPEVIKQTLAANTVMERGPKGYVQRPKQANQTLVLFFDEVNLPEADKYETQVTGTFIRQLLEHRGYWMDTKHGFVHIERVTIIAACNPPTDAGRVSLCPRLLRHFSCAYVDLPSPNALVTIYSSFISAQLLHMNSQIANIGSACVQSMVDIYMSAQQHFKSEDHAHYVYSPRELSRWTRALQEACITYHKNSIPLTSDIFIQLIAHEAERLFCDRLVTMQEQTHMKDIIATSLAKHITNAPSHVTGLMFSDLLHGYYSSIEKDKLVDFLQYKLRQFNDEELSVKLILFDDVIRHILRIDRVLKQRLGHALLVGSSGSGKTMLSRFVSWLNGMTAYQIKIHQNYSSDDFDHDIRELLIRSGVKCERICFIFDESNAISTAFLERMNNLLASGEMPGIFEGNDMTTLITDCRNEAKHSHWKVDGDTDQSYYNAFISNIQNNLHVIFTMNPAGKDFSNRAATSPALFNRCVVNWMGDWSESALTQVAVENTRNIMVTNSIDVGVKLGNTLHEADVKDGIVNFMVMVHTYIKDLCSTVAKKNQGRSTYVTPRHFLDLLSQFEIFYEMKQESIRKSLRHFTLGLQRLNSTQEQVLITQRELAAEKIKLSEKESKAKIQVDAIVDSKVKVELKEKEISSLVKEVTLKTAEVKQRKDAVEDNLCKVLPAVEAAKASVGAISKADLDQVTRFVNPPPLVKLLMEAICVLMGEKARDWNEMKQFMRKPDFIRNVINFDMDALNTKLRNTIERDYLAQEGFNVERMTQASRACGPLSLWVESVITYSKKQESIRPLIHEMKVLENEMAVLQKQYDENSGILDELRVELEDLTSNYALFIQQIQEIKERVERVEKSVDRSVRLLDSLAAENERWNSDRILLEKSLLHAIGDGLLSSAYVAYLGYFSQQDRIFALEHWCHHLKALNIPCTANYTLTNDLTSSSKHLVWSSYGLSLDPLSLDNAAMFFACRRCPLLIDPTGQAITFIKNMVNMEATTAGSGKGKLVVTSLTSPMFLRELETSLRFGNTLLVENVENIDPVLNSVLNNETSRIGGRVVITVGDKTIDLSPTFKLILCTSDPLATFTPDLCSRVTIINFSITERTLASQCLALILQTECPQLDIARKELYRRSGDLKEQLHIQEESLLTLLSDSRNNNILEDDTVTVAIETLKADAAHTMKQLDDLAIIETRTTELSANYTTLASALTGLYFSLNNIPRLSALYVLNFRVFLETVQLGLQHTPEQGDSPHSASKTTTCMTELGADKTLFRYQSSDTRVALPVPTLSQGPSLDTLLEVESKKTPSQLLCPIISLLGARLARSLQATHIKVVLLQCALVLIETLRPTLIDKHIINCLNVEMVEIHVDHTILAFMQEHHIPNLLSSSKQFAVLCASILGKDTIMASLSVYKQEWKQWLQSGRVSTIDEIQSNATSLLHVLGTKLSSIQLLLLQACLCRIFLPQEFPSAITLFCECIFGSSIFLQDNHLPRILQTECSSTRPLLLLSGTSIDVTSMIETAFGTNNIVIHTLGDQNTIVEAENLLQRSINQGNILVLHNLHIVTNWLSHQVQMIKRIPYGKDLRLILTAELGPLLATSLLHECVVIRYEAPLGVRQAFLRTIQPSMFTSPLVEVRTCNFNLAWLHTLVTERMKYIPLGWSMDYEFSLVDLELALSSAQNILLTAANNRFKIPVKDIPFDMLINLYLQSYYGSKIEMEQDKVWLKSLVSFYFSESGLFPKSTLMTNMNQVILTGPDEFTYESVYKWSEQLDIDNPNILGLPCDSNDLLLHQEALAISSSLRILTITSSTTTSPDGHNDRNSILMKQLETYKKTLHSLLFTDESSNRTLLAGLKQMHHHPLLRLLAVETHTLRELLQKMCRNMVSILNTMKGEERPTSYTRDLLQCLQGGSIPDSWMFGKGKYITLEEYIFMLQNGYTELTKIVVMNAHVCNLSTLTYIPMEYVTSPSGIILASKLLAASVQKCTLEEIIPVVTFMQTDSTTKCSETMFILRNVSLQGAKVLKDSMIELLESNETRIIPFVQIEWKIKDQQNTQQNMKHVPLCMYSHSIDQIMYIPVAIQPIKNTTIDEQTMVYMKSVKFTIQK